MTAKLKFLSQVKWGKTNGKSAELLVERGDLLSSMTWRSHSSSQQQCLQTDACGAGESLVVQRTHCASRGPVFDSQHPHGANNHQ